MEVVASQLTTLLAAAEEHAEEGAHHSTSFLGMMVYIVIVVAIIAILTSWMRKGLGPRTFTTRTARWAEHAYGFVENLCVGIIGPHGRKYIPIMMTFWLVIFVSNCTALFLPYAPTADMGFNLGMALVAITYVQVEGIKANGFFGHLSHFAGPKLGGPMVIISGLIFLIEMISEVMKNVSLSLRLFGNIEGGHMVVNALNNELGTMLMFPVGALLIPIKLMTCLVQAMIFVLLNCVYLSLVTHHEHEDDHGGTAHAGLHHEGEASAAH